MTFPSRDRCKDELLPRRKVVADGGRKEGIKIPGRQQLSFVQLKDIKFRHVNNNKSNNGPRLAALTTTAAATTNNADYYELRALRLSLTKVAVRGSARI